jgi:hypothetical protein
MCHGTSAHGFLSSGGSCPTDRLTANMRSCTWGREVGHPFPLRAYIHTDYLKAFLRYLGQIFGTANCHLSQCSCRRTMHKAYHNKHCFYNVKKKTAEAKMAYINNGRKCIHTARAFMKRHVVSIDNNRQKCVPQYIQRLKIIHTARGLLSILTCNF